MFNSISTTETKIPLSQIKPGRYQHRQRFNPAPLLELAGSIRESGLIQPPLVYQENGHYELLAGERRWRAMCALAIVGADLSLEQAVGLVSQAPPTLERWPVLAQVNTPVRLCGSDDATYLQTVAAVENLQREDLTPLEEAREFAALRDLGHSNVRIAKLTGKNGSYVKGMLDWLKLEPEIQELLDQELLHKDNRVAAALLSISDPALRLRLARQFADRRSPIKAILAVCKRAGKWPAALAPAPAVPVTRAQVEVVAPASPPTSTPCFCPACAVRIQELAEELCGGCRTRGLTPECLNCDGAIEFINRLIALNEAAYDV